MYSLVNNFIVAVSVFHGPDAASWQPVVTSETRDAIQSVHEEPGLAPLVAEDIWSEASKEASIDLLHAYINLQLIFDDSENLDAASSWWDQLLDKNPHAAASAVAQMDTKYIVWDLSQWPSDLANFISEYRAILMMALFESYQALHTEITVKQAEIDAFVPPDLTPPEGLPFRTDPSAVTDPKLKADYESRLKERARQRNAKVQLDKLKNVEGELLYSTSDNVIMLYKNANEQDVEHLVCILKDGGWDDSELATSISDDWPQLQHKLHFDQTGSP